MTGGQAQLGKLILLPEQDKQFKEDVMQVKQLTEQAIIN